MARGALKEGTCLRQFSGEKEEGDSGTDGHRANSTKEGRMKKRVKPSKKRGVSLKSAKRKRPAAPRAGRKARAAAVKPRRKPAPAKPRRKPAPVIMKPKRKPALTKGPSVATLQRRIQELDEQLRAREQDRTELRRWQEHHRQIQEQVKAKDSALAFKEKELMDLRRQLEELRAEAKKKEASA